MIDNKMSNLKPPAGPRWAPAAISAGLAVLVFAAFGQTSRHGFINFDDNDYVYQNPVVSRGLTRQGLAWAFGVHAVNWHPLTWISHMVDCQIYGLRPGGPHLTNVLLHLAAVILLFFALRRATGALWRSAFVAAVFAIHPLRAESVAWVAERKDVLSGLFFMLTLLAYLNWVRQPTARWRYGLVLVLYTLGLMSKPMLVSLPLVLLLLDYWPLQRKLPFARLLIEKLPMLALSVAAGLATIFAQSSNIGSLESYSFPMRLANAAVSCAIYLRQMIYPAGLGLFYPYPHLGLPAGEIALATLALLAISAVVWMQRRRQPWLAVGWLWFLIMLLPVLGIIQMGRQAHADRYTYLPQIGLYLALTWSAWNWLEKRASNRIIAGVASVLVLGGLLLCAHRQAAYWKDSETIWAHTVAVTKNNEPAHLNLGAALLLEGRVDDAIAEFQTALSLNATVPEAHYDLASAYLQEGRVDEAAPELTEALRLDPDFAAAHFSLGNIFFQRRQWNDAIAHYQAALKIRPAYLEARLNLANALMESGRADDAIDQFRAALQLAPDNAQAENNLGNALMQKGRLAEAITHFHAALQLRPDYQKAYVNLHNALLRQAALEPGPTPPAK
jgi:tetratricopeptide (TPR) repeat protein